MIKTFLLKDGKMKFRATKILFFLAITAFLIAPQIVFAGCIAEAEVRRFWEERRGFVQKVNVRIQVTSARPGAKVEVYVHARFHYERSDGWTSTLSTSGSAYIDTGESSGENLVLDNNVSNCSTPPNMPERFCHIHDVEIYDVSCHD